MNKKWWILSLILAVIVAALLLFVFFKQNSDQTKVTDFSSCVAAGNPVMESYPRQCKDKDGKTYTEVIQQNDDQSSANDNDDQSGNLPDETATINVFFSKEPESNDDFTYTVKSSRQTTRKDVGAFAIEQLIAGPTDSEEDNGLFSPLTLSGTSNCSGKDFSLSIGDNKKATLKFCKDVSSGGVGQDARIKETITDTLTQFPTITSVIILTKDNHCFGDLSGQDLCKE